MRGSVYFTASFSVFSRRRAKLPIIYPDIRLDYKLATLPLKVRPGEFAQTGVLPQPLILLGRVDPLNVRVDVDENDAWRVKAGAPATAFLRGNAISERRSSLSGSSLT